MEVKTADFCVIGGGVIGISIARELNRRFTNERIVVLEKEKDCGVHASGRNSGVLHAGFYYFPDSLKAKFTRLGNQQLTEYCDERKLRINKCGKLVVASSEDELSSLEELHRRGQTNGVPLEMLSETEARNLEPRIKTHEKALYSPTTSSVDPREVMTSMVKDAIQEGITICSDTRYLSRTNGKINTSRGSIEAGYVVNAGGLYADSIAREFGFSTRYRILPFKGLYLNSSEPAGSVKVHVYPVPNLKNPFLGVHYTLTVDGQIKIGPTAIPAFWLEQYKGLDNFELSEFLTILRRQIGLLAFSNMDFKTLALSEVRKYSKKFMVKEASHMLHGVYPDHYQNWGKPGIRAQLLDLGEKKLEMDFVIEGDAKSMHVLNAVSPAFTCSLPFSKYVCDKIQDALQ